MNNMKKLIINTSSNEEIRLGLVVDGKETVLKRKMGEQKTQVVLPMIEELMGKSSSELRDIGWIEVNTGHGSFTGLRVGIAVANALAFALNIPVNDRKAGEFVEPVYE